MLEIKTIPLVIPEGYNLHEIDVDNNTISFIEKPIELIEGNIYVAQKDAYREEIFIYKTPTIDDPYRNWSVSLISGQLYFPDPNTKTEIPLIKRSITKPTTEQLELFLETIEKAGYYYTPNKGVQNITWPNNWSNLKNIKGYFINNLSCLVYREANTIKPERNIYPCKDTAEASLYLPQLLQLRNWVWENHCGGWKPNWENAEFIYYIRMVGKEFHISSVTNFRNLFCFPTREIAQTFLDTYKDLLIKYSPLLG